jgi:hypothetical protein
VPHAGTAFKHAKTERASRNNVKHNQENEPLDGDIHDGMITTMRRDDYTPRIEDLHLNSGTHVKT